ncbi:MAG: ABC transporter ATP-binding protein [Rubricoccaceae bacterium]|nr:ABC transporter ATP-binding protein [Rubricoccaceae bacterium]
MLPVVNGLSFDVEEGELFALLGPSGCGKTTTLRLIAGFMRPDRGTIELRSEVLVDEHRFTPPEKRGIGFVFQDYALFPHLTVEQNIGFGLRKLSAKDRKARVRRVISIVGLDGLERRSPHALSGGQQQRVALARALAPNPRLLLLDEPFSNLDAHFRNEMRDRVRDILKKEGITSVLVTHDQEEALLFADRLGVMQGGRIDQVGTPEEIYLTPRTLFVAQFMGQTNLVLTHARGTRSDSVLGPLTLHREAEGPVLVAVRPEHFLISSSKDHEDDLEATVLSRAFKGHDITYRVQVGPVDCLVHTHNREPFAPGDTMYIRAIEPAVVLDKAGA